MIESLLLAGTIVCGLAGTAGSLHEDGASLVSAGMLFMAAALAGTLALVLA